MHDRLDGTDVDRLRYALSWVHGYDLVIVDCPPSLGGLTRTGLAACDRALVVTEPGLFAVMAVGRAMRTIDELRRGPAPALQPLGIVVNRVRSRSIEQAFRLEELQTLYGPLVLTPPVPERAALQQAQGAAQSPCTRGRAPRPRSSRARSTRCWTGPCERLAPTTTRHRRTTSGHPDGQPLARCVAFSRRSEPDGAARARPARTAG